MIVVCDSTAAHPSTKWLRSLSTAVNGTMTKACNRQGLIFFPRMYKNT